MTFRHKLQYFLVKKFQFSNKESLLMINEGEVSINNVQVFENVKIEITDTISIKNKVLQVGKKLLYIAYHKPNGIECTLNINIENNLKTALPFSDDLFPVGRLDKASEGLLLLTNHGQIFDKILREEKNIEKEYLVTVDNEINEEFLKDMKEGVEILGQITLPCKVEKINQTTFKIILTQGRNRQIRRMCYKLGFEVTKLIRLRIGQINLEKLKPNEMRHLNQEELNWIK